MEVIVCPDVEQLLTDAMRDELADHDVDVPVGTRVPSPRPAEFVRIMRTGGGGRRSLVLFDVQVTVEAWANRESRASTLADLCGALLPTFEFVYNVDEFSLPANLPDPTTGQHRYTATYQVTVRGTAA